MELARQLIRLLCDFTDPGEVGCSSCPWQAAPRMACLIHWMDWSLVGVSGSLSGPVSGILSSAHCSRFAVCGGAWETSHALAAWYTQWCSSEVKRVDISRRQSSQLGWWLCMMLVKSSITACGSSEYAGVCCCQFRRSVVVKGWYTYCMGPATYDPSDWGNGGPGAWYSGNSASAGVPASLLVSFPEFSDLPQ
jgi:hypothetical protein